MVYYPEKPGIRQMRATVNVCAVKKDDRTFIAALLGSGWPPHKGYKWSDVQTLLTMATRIIVIRLLISAKEFRIGRYML